MTNVFDVGVIGGGAAGLTAAIAAGRKGRRVVVFERMPRLGKKILVTGGGRCNLSNKVVSTEAYSATDSRLVDSVLRRFGGDRIRGFFEELGLAMTAEADGRIFPASQQAASVLKVLELEIRRLGIAVELGFEAGRIDRRSGGFSLSAEDGRRDSVRSLILACGGMSYPALGSNGNGYELAGRFGHGIVHPVPCAVPLLVKDRMCHALQGQKLRARARAVVGGNILGSAEGEILFTQYGLSGTAVIDVSEPLSAALNRDGRKDAILVADFVPFLTESELAAEMTRRLRENWAIQDLVSGILPEKFGTVLSGLVPVRAGRPEDFAHALASALKEKSFPVLGTRGWNEAEFTSGGVDAREIDPATLESFRSRGVHFAGEILDVQGRRGGFNLAWAWASGHLAGEAAAQRSAE